MNENKADTRFFNHKQQSIYFHQKFKIILASGYSMRNTSMSELEKHFVECPQQRGSLWGNSSKLLEIFSAEAERLRT